MRNLFIFFTVLLALSSCKKNTNKTPDKVSFCQSCHGFNGAYPLNSSIPKIAGQNKVYMKNELEKFKNKTRYGSSMNNIASSLTDEEIEDLSEYFSRKSCK